MGVRIKRSNTSTAAAADSLFLSGSIIRLSLSISPWIFVFKRFLGRDASNSNPGNRRGGLRREG